jgi:LAGLIDADG endonuclease
VNRNNKPIPEIRLNYQIDQKDKNVLLPLKDIFGGNIGYRDSQDTYYYGSTSFGSASKVIHYFDNFHLQSSKHINYLK